MRYRAQIVDGDRVAEIGPYDSEHEAIQAAWSLIRAEGVDPDTSETYIIPVDSDRER